MNSTELLSMNTPSISAVAISSSSSLSATVTLDGTISFTGLNSVLLNSIEIADSTSKSYSLENKISFNNILNATIIGCIIRDNFNESNPEGILFQYF